MGSWTTESGYNSAFLYSDGVMTNIGNLGYLGDYALTSANAINDFGQSVGVSFAADGAKMLSCIPEVR